ncbi:MAG: bifunctional hydroxymethylpyrimidine kinase/phosphomethylpyrimidine kinase, partial [Verrucomicrobia bacterium]|nr:bifunctional hydroxymethylpyrimidine kinase/phosphomethylpyrimidine kinase [Verrucomicrobiota bacterium]
GAGIQADLKTFALEGVHGTAAITCLTAQNPARVTGILACPPQFVRKQLEAVFELLPPDAAKTGMLFSPGIVREVHEFFSAAPPLPVVVDPVMISTSGARLLSPRAERAIQDLLLPGAALVTPNLDEAAVLIGERIVDVEGLAVAARKVHARWGCPALIKGGHLRGLRQAVDVLFDGRKEHHLTAPYVRGVSTHGTGCTYSAAIAAGLAKGNSLVEAVRSAKALITQAIRNSVRIGRRCTALGVTGKLLS